jgi:hypothetical protein
MQERKIPDEDISWDYFCQILAICRIIERKAERAISCPNRAFHKTHDFIPQSKLPDSYLAIINDAVKIL